MASAIPTNCPIAPCCCNVVARGDATHSCRVPGENRGLHAPVFDVVIRCRATQRRLAWFGLFAMLLVALAPTISQWRASASPHAGMHAMHHAMAMGDMADPAHAMHMRAAAHGHASDPDDWKQCGYCDFFAQAPSVGGVAHPPFATITLPQPLPPVFVATRLAPRFVIAACPRGPPSFA